MAIARCSALVALCVLLPAFAAAARPAQPSDFVVQGRVYCDTCQFGYETPYSTYIAGAKVAIKCRDIKTNQQTYSCEGETDESGTYRIPVSGEHAKEICETELVSSPQSNCAAISPGQERARLALSHDNGIASDKRYANNMGFKRDAPLAGCALLLKQYQEFDD